MKAAADIFIDAGGTFTDSLAWLPDGSVRQKKILTSGRIPGAINSHRNPNQFTSHDLADFPNDFFLGASIQFLHPITDSRECSFTCSRSESGTITTAQNLPGNLSTGMKFEILTFQSAPELLIRYFTQTPRGASPPPVNLRYASTLGTNALLERKGEPTAFITTCGFKDILIIKYQNRPALFDLKITRPEPLFSISLEIDERLDAQGRILVPLDETGLREHLKTIRQAGISAVAICFMHADINPVHELQAEMLARKTGFQHVFPSHKSCPLIKMIPRADTAVLDSYLTPILTSHLQQLATFLSPGSQMKVMTSAGGLVDATRFQGKESILSGPAGGFIALEHIAQMINIQRIIGFDMGGTSTDVSRYDSGFDYRFNTEIQGIHLSVPMLDIETVAAGGGSVCRFDSQKLTAGPDSAGADPGPACYGHNGPLTITDVNLFMGYVLPGFFPFPLDLGPVTDQLKQIQHDIVSRLNRQMSLEQIAEGFRTITNHRMAEAIRKISISKGYDPREYALCSFGGAGPQHACSVADLLGVQTIIIHPYASILSAVGLSLAPFKIIKTEQIMTTFESRKLPEWQRVLESMTQKAENEIRKEGIHGNPDPPCFTADVHFSGQSFHLTVPFNRLEEIPQTFKAMYQHQFGYIYDDLNVEIAVLRVESTAHPKKTNGIQASQQKVDNAPAETRRIFLDGQWKRVKIYHFAWLVPDQIIDGPAIIIRPDTSVLLESSWQLTVSPEMVLLLSRVKLNSVKDNSDNATGADPVLLEVFNHLFESVAEQMGVMLQKTSLSTNVKERLDFSCAVFSSDGALTANAPHIPVHLGAMSDTIRHLLQSGIPIRPGDVIVTNDPYLGGSHLPDITVINPVFHENRLVFFTAARAHHAEIGGIVPGSTPPFSKNLAQEGVVIRHFKLFEAGEFKRLKIHQILTSGPYPSRRPDENIADILAQTAACRRGADLLFQILNRYQLNTMLEYMHRIRNAASKKMMTALSGLGITENQFTDYLDDGTPIHLSLKIREGRAIFDFTGSGPVSPGNLNANPAIVRSAVIYCLRCLIREDIPLNEGVMAPTTLIIPEGLLNPPGNDDPEQCAAVCGGNVETSQRITDVILGAMGVMAAGQGTMNNVSFGNHRFSYYETLGGGSGAGPNFHGTDAVQVHMTNTRITDPEVLERSFPVRILHFSIRAGSGGAGLFNGGNGISRRIEFLCPMTVSIVSERRGPTAPYGIAGGNNGSLGENVLIQDGSAVQLRGKAQLSVKTHDQLEINTPGGGGWGHFRSVQ